MDNQEKIILSSNEIESKIHDLNVVDLGIHDPIIRNKDTAGYVRIPPSMPPLPYTPDEPEELKESTHSPEEFAKIVDEHHAMHPLQHEIANDKESLAHDEYIRDKLKSSHADPSTVMHIHNVIGDMNTGLYGKMAVSSKWLPFIGDHFAKKPNFKNNTEVPVSPKEYDSVDVTRFRPLNGRLFEHKKTTSVFELQHDGSMNLITDVRHHHQHTRSSAYNPPADPYPKNLLHASLAKHYAQFPHESVNNYTLESVGVNRYLHKKHEGHEYGPEDTIFGKYVSSLERDHKNISSHIAHVTHNPHTPDFHVYTGMAGENRPDMSPHVDKDGNYLVHSPSFTSTSITKSVATDFARSKTVRDINGPVHDIMRIKIKGGYPRGMYVQPQSEHAHENEYLLDAGHTFKVNPNPRYFMHDGKFFRHWEATIHHDMHPDEDFHSLSTQGKMLRLMHDDAPRQDIEEGAKHENTYVRATAAKHPNLSHDTMQKLIHDDVPAVRTAARMNPALPHHLIDEALKTDETANVGLAHREYLAEPHIHKLIHSGFDSVQAAVAQRTDLKPHHIAALIDKGGVGTHISLAANHTMPRDLLNEYANHEDHRVRLSLAQNPAAPMKAINRLTMDDSAIVRTTARGHPMNHTDPVYEHEEPDHTTTK